MTKAALLTPLQDLSAAFTGPVAKVAPSIVSVSSHRSRSSGFQEGEPGEAIVFSFVRPIAPRWGQRPARKLKIRHAQG